MFGLKTTRVTVDANELRDHNEIALAKLRSQDKNVIDANPEFFDQLDTYGFQRFNIVKIELNRFLEVTRTIFYNGMVYTLDATRYQLDMHSVIIKNTAMRMTKKIRNILGGKYEE